LFLPFGFLPVPTLAPALILNAGAGVGDAAIEANKVISRYVTRRHYEPDSIVKSNRTLA
jgi:hypothetical protein